MRAHKHKDKHADQSLKYIKHDLNCINILYSCAALFPRGTPGVALTVDLHHHALAHGRRDVVGGDAQVGPHVVSRHLVQHQLRPVERLHCNGKQAFS